MLVDVGTYRRLTGDSTSADADVLTALADAQDDVELYVGRPGRLIEQGTVTENLRVYRGVAFPSVTPVASVTDPQGAVIDGALLKSIGGVVQTGVGFITGYGTDDNLYPLTVSVTYVGGWTSATLPRKVQRAICRLATLDLVTAPVAVPVGATSVRLGDAAVAYPRPQTPDAARQEILDTLSGFRYRLVSP